jgi:sporulation protein YlmC with PRC-barrel domain|tara:strand:- start:31723 stop:31971 length:249 start_codon:yes stop_codon:yes gene_type:complete
MDQAMPTANLLGAGVYDARGSEVGVISELQIDPAAGIVRFARIALPQQGTVLMPWAAMFRVKYRQGFVLTARGEELLRENLG